MMSEWLTVIEIAPGFYAWVWFEHWTLLSNVSPKFLQQILAVSPSLMLTVFAWGAAFSLLCQENRSMENLRDCKLQCGDPVDDSRARITLKLTV